MLRILLRAALRLVPGSWRESVRRDLLEEAGERGAGAVWQIRQAARIGMALRLRIGGARAAVRQGLRRRAPRPWNAGIDLRLALRSFRRDGGTTAAIVVALALGIGAASAAHAIFNFVLFRPVPGVSDESSLVSVYFQPERAAPNRIAVSHRHLVAMREQIAGLSGLAAHYRTDFPVRTRADAAARMTEVTQVTLEFFHVIGARAVRGRLFGADEYESEQRLAIISERLWRVELGGIEPIGHSILIAGQPFLVIGVVDDFRGLDRFGREGIWIPFGARNLIGRRVNSGPDAPEHQNLIGRLSEGTSPGQVQAHARAVYDAIGAMPGFDERRQPIVFEGITDGIGVTGGRLLRIYQLLMAGIGLLFTLACANAANLLLARNVRRLPALALRSAIGATRGRLLREQLVETLLLCAAAGMVGLGIGWMLLEAFEGSHLLSYLPALQDVTLDRRVLAFTLLASSAAVMVAGLLPALVASRSEGRPDAVANARVASRSNRLSIALVSAQVALGLTLVAGSGVLLQTIRQFGRVDLGVDVEGLTSFIVSPPRLGYDADQTDLLLARIERNLSAAPGLEGVSLSFFPPFTGTSMMRIGRTGEPVERARPIAGRYVSASYFETVGTPLLDGRSFERSGPGVDPPDEVVLSADLARQLFEASPASGRDIVIWSRGRATRHRVVGVARDVHTRDLRDGIVPTIYRPFGREWRAAFQVRSRLPEGEAAQAIRAALAAVDPNLPAADLGPVREQVNRNLSEERVLARLSAAIALLAALLGSFGIYALMSFLVAGRRREFGIRMALGAPREAILSAILGRALVTTLIGLAAGLPLYRIGSRYLESRLFGVAAHDPWIISGACVVLLSAGVVAAWRPAVRATRVDPIAALRSE